MIVDGGYEGEWDGWQNAGWGVSNWTIPPPPPPDDDSHVRSHRHSLSVTVKFCSSNKCYFLFIHSFIHLYT